ncbi:dioxygenase [Roseivivax marinus]|uniref:Dioxygenase n=1 Tax=Roseivivax marinus TaxID=1379903 RepID=W4HKE5_9RHOB|nr:aromatic ring-hydroxylating dioxygenase subunit alpha [Roseivivax marinus]ETW12868.1 dioxygenase [Roseivivax marinus]UMA64571.1 aromatic ring-hydroxylating dioxygenase subunit alpha [Roseivivax marinus]SEL52471.1 Rieske 2Fe-2S family protein [Roseivivax marinus]
MLRDADVLSLLLQRQPGHSLARDFYTDPGLFEVDMQRIWYRDWLISAASAELPKPGNYVTRQIGAYSVILVRGHDGVARAFHNSCRHRGSRICSAAKGTNPKLVCPYHQWTYELDGRLLWARDMGPDFDPSKHGLKTVHCEEAGGLILICLAEHAPDVTPFLEAAEAYAGPHDMKNLKVAYQSNIVEQGNWKLVMENNRECYHCAGSHPSLCRTFPEDPKVFGTNPNEQAPALRDHIKKCEDAGMPSAFKAAPDTQWRFVRIPFVGNASSYTMDGKPAVSKRTGRVPFDDAGSCLVYHYPSSWNHFLSDNCLVFRMTPISPTQTEVSTTWLVNKDAVEGVDYDLEKLTEVWIHTNDEDRAIVEENQRGVNSPAYVPGPYSQQHESGVIQFVDWYARTLQERLTGRAMLAAE